MHRTGPSRRVYDISKDHFSLTQSEELENGQHVHKCCVGDYVYSQGEVLGSGFSATVYKATWKGNAKQRYAIKVIDLKKFKTDSTLDLLDMEVEIVMSLNHPNIIQCLDVFKTKAFYYLVFEYCPHGDLQQLIRFQKCIAEDRAIIIMKQILEGYKVLMNKNIIHRDLKPANIMRFGNKWKIGDFGFARYCKNQYVLDTMLVGTPLYLAPQCLEMKKYSDRGDIFALGIMLYEMLKGTTPWNCQTQRQLLKCMKESQGVEIPQKIISQQLKDFLKRSLEKDFYARMSKQELRKFTLEEIDLQKVAKLRPPISASPMQRNLSKSNGKQFAITPMKIHHGKVQQNKNGLSPFIGDQIVQTPRQQVSKPTRTRLFVPMTPQKNEKEEMTEKQLQISDYESSPSPVSSQASSPLHSPAYRNNAALSYNQIDFIRAIMALINNIHSLNLDRKERSYLVCLLSRFCIMDLRMLKNSRTNMFKLQRWDSYKKTQRYAKVIQEVTTRLQKYEAWSKDFESKIPQTVRREVDYDFPEFHQADSILNYKFYFRFCKILKLFIKEFITIQIKLQIQNQQERASFYEGISQLIEILKIFNMRTNLRQHAEGIGITEKVDFIEWQVPNDVSLKSLQQRQAQLEKLCQNQDEDISQASSAYSRR